jgi:hypothetical protein
MLKDWFLTWIHCLKYTLRIDMKGMAEHRMSSITMEDGKTYNFCSCGYLAPGPDKVPKELVDLIRSGTRIREKANE